MDGITTGVDSAVHGEYKPNGLLGAIDNAIEAEGSAKAGAIFDAVLMPVGDGLAGFGAGKMASAAGLRPRGAAAAVDATASAAEIPSARANVA